MGVKIFLNKEEIKIIGPQAKVNDAKAAVLALT